MKFSTVVLSLLVASTISFSKNDTSDANSNKFESSSSQSSLTIVDENSTASNTTSGYTLCLKKGWNLMGTEHEITDLSMFDASCIDMVFAYSDEKYRRYSKHGNSSLEKIGANSGFWVKTGYECSITEGNIIENPPCSVSSEEASSSSSSSDENYEEETESSTSSTSSSESSESEDSNTTEIE